MVGYYIVGYDRVDLCIMFSFCKFLFHVFIYVSLFYMEMLGNLRWLGLGLNRKDVFKPRKCR